MDTHPVEALRDISKKLGYGLDDVRFARHMDSVDPVRCLRDEFCYPKMKDIGSADLELVDAEEECVYFCGNSLGLCPKKVKDYMNIDIEKWEKTGVNGHRTGEFPWERCAEILYADMEQIVGAKTGEVSLTNGLTVNLHLLLISFYRPTPKRHKILMESKAFPSDHYAVKSQIQLHGYDPETSMVCLELREGESTYRTEDILAYIEEHGDSIAVVCFSGLHYYTGQLFEMEKITKAGHAKGCYVGWDLAHAVGNVELFLHDWQVDFACWCTYKYLNGGSGCLGGLFLHEMHFNNNFPKLLGWWGHELSSRFVMDNKMVPYKDAKVYRLSNTPGFLCPSLKASFEIFRKTSMKELRTKSKLLTGYLEEMIKRKYGDADNNKITIDIFTPSDPEQRGTQLSLSFSVDISVIHKEMNKRGIVCDERLPSVIRVAPVPLYSSFEDVYRFMKYLDEAVKAAAATTIKS